MGKYSEQLLKILEARRKQIDAVERETAAALAALLDGVEGAQTRPASAEAGVAAETGVTAEEVAPLAEIAVSPRCRIALIKADISRLPVDAIVNPASSSLQGGGGIEGAIFAAGGPKLIEECRRLGGCERGEAKLTNGHDLPARYVIHTVGPVWKGGDHGEPEVLAACYRNSLALAMERGVKTIAFPAISTGNFGYPMLDAARVAVRETAKAVVAKPGLERVYLVSFTDEAAQAFSQAMLEIAAK
jgi:O-acetyl-ADP-ribose deacetylase